MNSKATLRTCPKGHRYYKSSDCPTCPICEQEGKPQEGFLALLSAPARRALEAHGVNTLEKLARLTEKEVLSFHGIGKASLPVFHQVLKEKGLAFRPKE